MYFKTSYQFAHSYRKSGNRIDSIPKLDIDSDLVADPKVFDKKSVYQKTFAGGLTNHKNELFYSKKELNLNNVPAKFFDETRGDLGDVRGRYHTVSNLDYKNPWETRHIDLERQFEFPAPKKIKDQRPVFKKPGYSKKSKLYLPDSPTTLFLNDAITLYNNKTKCQIPPEKKIYSIKRNVPAKLPSCGKKSAYQTEFCCDCCVRKVIVHCGLGNEITQVVK